jgi:hypothetical protein
MNPVVKEREQSLARELNLQAPEEERAQALVPEISLRAVDKTLPSQAGTQTLTLTTMRANSEETIVINPLALHAPTTTLELNPRSQDKHEAIKGMNEWCDKNTGTTASERIIYLNNLKAAAAVAANRKMKLLPFETRPFNYARLKEDEAPLLHLLNFDRNKGDDAEDGKEHFSP